MNGQLATRPPRNAWDLLDDAFDLYRGRFLHYAALAAVLYLPAQALNVALSVETHAWFLGQQTGREESSDSLFQYGDLLAQVGVLQIPLAFSVVFLGAGVAESVWAQLQGQELSTIEVLRRVLRRASRYALIALTLGFINLVAFSFCGIGHWATATWFLTVPAALQLERMTFPRALRKASTRQKVPLWWRSLGLLFLTEAVSGLLLLGMQILILGIFSAIPSPLTGNNKDLREFLFTSSAASLCRYLLAPVGALAASLLYIDLRIRQEALDLVTAAEAEGVPLLP